ncbi:MAG: hypothetical protein U0800_22615 [Isosphaeraceae bacterium]
MLAVAWTEATDEDIRLFVNTIPTRDGGTHEQGSAAVSEAVHRCASTTQRLKKGLEVKGEDVREGLTAIFSVFVREPQFQGQTKGRLNNTRSVRSSNWPSGLAWKTSCSRTAAWPRRSAQRVIQAAKAREARLAAAKSVSAARPRSARG